MLAQRTEWPGKSKGIEESAEKRLAGSEDPGTSVVQVDTPARRKFDGAEGGGLESESDSESRPCKRELIDHIIHAR